MIKEQVEDIEMSLERFFSVEEVLSLTLKLFTGMNPVGMSIPMWFVGNMVGKTNSCELDMFEELKAVEEMNLFTIFPIGTIMQDGGKRKRSDSAVTQYCYGHKLYKLLLFIIIKSTIYYIRYIGRL